MCICVCAYKAITYDPTRLSGFIFMLGQPFYNPFFKII